VQVRKSARLKQLLQAVLLLGNRANGQGRAGDGGNSADAAAVGGEEVCARARPLASWAIWPQQIPSAQTCGSDGVFHI
jgi:hypothetical protein